MHGGLVGVAAALVGCDRAAGPHQGEPTSGAENSGGGSHGQPILHTPLGEIQLTGADQTWRQRTTRSAKLVADVWGSTDVRLRVTKCDSDADFEAVADGIDAATAGVTTASGVFIAPRVDRSLTPTGRDVLMAHELVHARLRHWGDNPTALWVREGAAEWTATRRLTMPKAQLWPNLFAMPSNQRPSGPPSVADFTSDGPLSYERANAYLTFLVAVAGQSAVTRWVQSQPHENSANAAASALIPRGAVSFSRWLERELKTSAAG